MRIAHVFVMMIATAAMTALHGCDRDTSSDSGSASPPPPPSPTTARRISTTNPFLAVTQPTTQSLAAAATNPADPLATPDSAITYLFELMRKQDVGGVRAMMADPQATQRLSDDVGKVAERLNGGAKWGIVDSRIDGVAAIVIYRTTFPDGKEDTSAVVLVNRYDRWKVLLGPLNPRKFSPGEKESINKVGRWANERLEKLRGATTAPSTTSPATRTTPTS